MSDKLCSQYNSSKTLVSLSKLPFNFPAVNSLARILCHCTALLRTDRALEADSLRVSALRAIPYEHWFHLNFGEFSCSELRLVSDEKRCFWHEFTKKFDLIAQIIGGWKENEPERIVNKVKLINMWQTQLTAS